jgi:hypothetical protein
MQWLLAVAIVPTTIGQRSQSFGFVIADQSHAADLMVLFGFVPLFALLFPMAMGVDYRKAKNDNKNHDNDNNQRLVSPNLADEVGSLRIH